MRYELECGHCGYQFVLDATELPRTTRCAVCGGVLAIVVPVAVAPPPAPAPPRPAPPPTPVPRERRLAEPWPSVRGGMNVARAAADFARAAFVFFLFLVFCALLIPARERHEADWRLVALGGSVLVLPVIMHVVGQWLCMKVPRAHGRGMVNTSLLSLSCAAGGVIPLLGDGATGRQSYPTVLAFVPAGVAALVLSFVFWLTFLVRLGRHLGDDALAKAARAYRAWLPLGLLLAAALLTATPVAAHRPPLVWFGRFAAGATGFVLLGRYAALLRTAVEAIDRRAPVAPHR